MSLKEKYLNDFNTLRIIHNVSESKKTCDNVPLLTEAYAFINSIISPALERKIGAYLFCDSKKTFISTFEFTVYTDTSGKAYLLHDSDVKYFGDNLHIFHFISTKDTDLIYQYIKYVASKADLDVNDYDYEGEHCLSIGVQY